jgi:transcriptional regulator with XRE-family HTH domain
LKELFVTTDLASVPSEGAAPLALCRLARGFTQAALAERAKVARETISRLERGGRPQLRNAQAIAAALDFPLDLVFPALDGDD